MVVVDHGYERKSTEGMRMSRSRYIVGRKTEKSWVAVPRGCCDDLEKAREVFLDTAVTHLAVLMEREPGSEKARVLEVRGSQQKHGTDIEERKKVKTKLERD